MNKKYSHKTTLVFTLALTLAACQSGSNRSPVVTPQKMTCAGDKPAQVILYSPEEAVLTFEEKAYELRREETISGAKYANRSISFWNKGIDALITRDDGTVTTCTFIPKQGL